MDRFQFGQSRTSLSRCIPSGRLEKGKIHREDKADRERERELGPTSVTQGEEGRSNREIGH
jgi:hypothetical protein